MKILTIIIPIYNVEKYLSQCLKSCLVHDNEIEYILVNDGSTDNSKKIACDIIKNYSNAHLISQQNGGLSAARNTGLKHVTGQWVYFIDSDDFVSENLILNLLNELKKKKFSTNLLSLPFIKIWSNNKSTLIQDGSNNYVSNIDFAIKVLESKKEISVCALVFRVSYLKAKKINFKNGFLFEDQFFTPKVLRDNERIYEFSASDTGYYFYRMHEGSITHSDLTESNILALVKAETFKSDYLVRCKSTNSVMKSELKKAAINNKINVYFRAYVDLIILDKINAAKKIQKELYKISNNSKKGKKQKLKIYLTFLPKFVLKIIFKNKILSGK